MKRHAALSTRLVRPIWSPRNISSLFLGLAVTFISTLALASTQTTEPAFSYGIGSAGEAPSLPAWKSQQNAIQQAAFDACKSSDPEHYVCTQSVITGEFVPSTATYHNGIQDPIGIVWTQTTTRAAGGDPTVKTLNTQIRVGRFCPEGFSLVSRPLSSRSYETTCVLMEPDTNECEGDPIMVYSGEKFEHEVDFVSADGVLKLQRIFKDQYSGWDLGLPPETLFDTFSPNFQHAAKGVFFGKVYSRYTLTNKSNLNETEDYLHTFDLKYKKSDIDSVNIQIGRHNHRLVSENGKFVGEGPSGKKINLVKQDDQTNQGSSWKLSRKNGDVSYFNSTGKLVRKTLLSGGELFYTYNERDKLATVTDHIGRSLVYNYDNYDRVTSVTLPNGDAVTYEYGEDERLLDFKLLKKVSWSNGESRTYLYNESSYVDAVSSTLPLLTGKLDALGQRIDTTKYQSKKAVYNEEALGIRPRAFSRTSYTVKVTDGLNSTRTYQYSGALKDGTRLLNSTNKPAGSGCTASTESRTYYSNGMLKTEADFNGNKTQYVYDAVSFLETTRVEGIPKADTKDYTANGVALGSGIKKVSTRWHPQHEKPVTVYEPQIIRSYIYNGDTDPFNSNQIARCSSSALPLLCHKVVQASLDANGAAGYSATIDSTVQPRETYFTYDDLGQILTIKRGAQGVQLQEEREYYDSSSANWMKGDLKSVTNALGHKSEFLQYDRNGRLLQMIDANGTEILFAYDARGRTTSQSIDGEITTHEYDLNGNRTSSQLPNGVQVSYEYDAARLLNAVVDSVGNRIEYEYDIEGNLTDERVINIGGGIVYLKNHVRDALSRVQSSADGNGNSSTYLYDAEGNLTGVTDAKQQSNTNTFDPLNRLTLNTDPLKGATRYSYDLQGNLTRVTDPKNNATTYTYNAFGDLVTLTSTDTGTTRFTYDSTGNLTTVTDARNVVRSYTYDALDRVKTISYPASPAENVLFSYDDPTSGNNGIGHLSEARSNDAIINYTYTPSGLVAGKRSSVSNQVATVAYEYDSAGLLTKLTYPSGRIVNYLRDSNGRIAEIATQKNQTSFAQPVVSEIEYMPFGPARAFKYANGLSFDQTFDNAYRPTSIAVFGLSPLFSRSYGYDAVNNITSINDDVSSTHSQMFTYDALNRLVGANGAYGGLAYTYDSVGNRLSETYNGAVSNYVSATSSNRLSSISSTSGNRSFTYDAAGNITQGTRANGTVARYAFNNANRLVSATIGGAVVATYTYDPIGQRVSKTLPTGQKEIYTYDEEGHLISVADGSGNNLREYIYWDSLQIAFARNDAIYFIHNDHLGTPQLMTTASQSVAWRKDYQPFGLSSDRGENAFEIGSRFPGQYFDSETGLHYNYFRDYDPTLGRYIESDPIGLRGGINTYAYVGGNPVNAYDPNGLQPLFDPEPDEFSAGASDMLQAYNEMEHTPWEPLWHTRDKYFHCLGNCNATRRGAGGAGVACAMSDFREGYQQAGSGSSEEDSKGDQRANSTGRWLGENATDQSCSTMCGLFYGRY